MVDSDPRYFMDKHEDNIVHGKLVYVLKNFFKGWEEEDVVLPKKIFYNKNNTGLGVGIGDLFFYNFTFNL